MQINNTLAVAMLIALTGGVAIGMQSVVINTVGGTVGPVRTAFLIHVGGSVVGGIMLLGLTFAGQGGPLPQFEPRISAIFLFSGLMGMIVLPSIAISFPRTGLVAGQILLIVGQTVVALIVDTTGIAGVDPIPLDRQRLLGLAFMVLAAYLLLPSPAIE